MRIADVPDPEDDSKPTSPEVGDQLWAFIPIIVGVAAVCLLMFFLVTPSFEATDSMDARSTRPGAETVTTRPENK